jgi:hypothetical protein
MPYFTQLINQLSQRSAEATLSILGRNPLFCRLRFRRRDLRRNPIKYR